MELIKKQLVCERCGSIDIVFDTTAVWNFRLQKFQYEIFDCYCNDCGDTCGAREMSIRINSLTNIDVL